MDTLLRALLIFGYIQAIIAWLWLVVVAWREGAVHGILMFLFGGIYGIIFSILHWDEAKKPFLMSLLGGAMIMGAGIARPILAAPPAPEPEFAAMTAPADAPGFKQRLAAAIASRIATTLKRGSPQARTTLPSVSDFGSASTSDAVSVQATGAQSVSDASGKKKSRMALLSKKSASSAATVKPASTNEWDQARALLRVSGVMKTGNQLFATVNQKIVKVNDDIAVEMNGRTYRFKVRRIDFKHNIVQFDPVER